MNISTLKTESYVKVAYPKDLREVVDEAMSSWQAFCAMSEVDKLKLGNPDRHNDQGYNLRREHGSKADAKEFVHMIGEWVPEFYAQAREVTDERALAFVKATDELIQHIKPMINDFAQSVEVEYDIPGFADEVMRHSSRWVFRYIHYFGGEMLAHAHPDRGGFTLHLAETAPGGEYLAPGGVWKPWPVTEHETIIFPSMVLQHRTKCALKALWHRVGATPITAENGRYALVVFVDFDHTHKYSDASGRLQEKPEGFNWNMSFAEFDKLFELRT